METVKEVETITLDLVVKDVTFGITPTGSLFPMVQLHVTKELNKLELDAVAFQDLTEVLELNLVKGCGVQIIFEKESRRPKGVTVTVPSIVKLVLPVSCPSCAGPLIESSQKQNTILCNNQFCSGQSKATIHKMISYAANATPTESDTFVDCYMISDAMNSIDNISDFKLMWNIVKNKDTNSRRSKWITLMPEYGERMFEIESDIDCFLKNGSYREFFWDICNFPKISEAQLIELSAIDPEKLLNMKYDLKAKNLSNKVIRYLSNNTDYVSFLYSMFEGFIEKTEG